MNQKDKLIEQLRIAFGDSKLGEFEIIDKRLHPDLKLIHISDDPKIRAFVPRVSANLFTGETTAIPRLSTAPHLMRCMLGYGDIWLKQQVRTQHHVVPYTIYEIPEWEYAVLPSKKFQPDVEYTLEHWLVPYSIESRIYKPAIAGEFYLRSVILDYVKDDEARHYRFFVRVVTPFDLIDGVRLHRGFYEVEVKDYQQPWMKFELDSNLFVRKIKEGEYLLSYATNANKKK